MSRKVFLGMSGGVDSSLSAVLLKEQGYDVVGVFMKNWSSNLPGAKCPWAEDLAEAKRVATRLGIDFRVCDFEEEYREKVVDYMLAEVKAGRTPNPDIICNQEIKFKLFYEKALEQGADLIATGHYARVENEFTGGKNEKSPENSEKIPENQQKNHKKDDMDAENRQEMRKNTENLAKNCENSEKSIKKPQKTCENGDKNARNQQTNSEDNKNLPEIAEKVKKYQEVTKVTKVTGNTENPPNSSQKSAYPRLLTAVDANKDQTYFLYRMPASALARTLFPVGNLKKTEVKRLAEAKGLPNAYRKESMGVCFVGAVEMRDFLAGFIAEEPGEIVELETGKVLGEHRGAVFYTLGQRHGLYLGGGLPYYVAGKDVEKNLVFVSKNLNSPALWAEKLKLLELVWRPNVPATEFLQGNDTADTGVVWVRLRHRAPLIPAKLQENELIFAEKVRRPAAGQSAVFYRDGECLGGGVVAE